MSKATPMILGLVSLVLVTSVASGQLLSELPMDLEGKVIDGTHAMAVVPSLWSGLQHEGYLPPEGFVARLQNVERPGEELAFPAATWFLPPPGWYHVWAEGNGWVSPSPEKLSYSGSVEMLVRPDMVPGGRVRLGEPFATSGHTFLLLSANPQYRGANPPYEMKRLLPAATIGEGLMVAEGMALAGLWEETTQAFSALARPFRVEHERTVVAPLEVPTTTAHLFVELRRNFEAEDGRPGGIIEPVLRYRDRERPADIVIPTVVRTYAVWYDLQPGNVVLTASSPFTVLVPEVFELEAGRIEHRLLRMAPRRALQVDLELPSPLDQEEVTLAVRPLPQGPTLSEITLAPKSSGHRFDGLAPSNVEVELTTSLGSFRDQIDLRDAEVGYLTIAPDLLTLWGTVALGGEGHAAKIVFRSVGGEEVMVDTSEHGDYEAAFLDAVRSVNVQLLDSDVAPFVDFFSTAIAEDRELDFNLIDVENRVEVVDSQTGDPLPGARVTVRNVYEQRDEALDRLVEKALMQQVEAGEEGVALLPPFRKGSIEVKASAAGYLPLNEPVRREVLDPTQDVSLRIALDPLGDTVEVSLRLPDGTPASGAEMLLVGGVPGQPALFTGRADAEGVLRVPRAETARLALARHPGAASDLRAWPPSQELGTFTWTLTAAAPTPLTIEVRAPGGDGPMRQAELALRWGDHLLTGQVLGWLTRSRPYTDSNGHWVGQGLPPAPLAVIAFGPSLAEEAAAGGLETLATEVSYPWPAAPVVIEAVR